MEQAHYGFPPSRERRFERQGLNTVKILLTASLDVQSGQLLQLQELVAPSPPSLEEEFLPQQ
jgi:hypothetical protein